MQISRVHIDRVIYLADPLFMSGQSPLAGRFVGAIVGDLGSFSSFVELQTQKNNDCSEAKQNSIRVQKPDLLTSL